MSGLDLFLSQREPAMMFVYATVAGFLLGVVYGVLCLLRLLCGDTLTRRPRPVEADRQVPAETATAADDPNDPNDPNESNELTPSHRPLGLRVLAFVTDLIFALTVSLTLILLLYYTSDGQFRAPAPIGMACGFFVYVHTLGRILLHVGDALARCIRHLVRAVLRVAWHIVRFIAVRLVWRPLRWILKPPLRLVRWLWCKTACQWIRAAREAYARRAERTNDPADDGEVPPAHLPEPPPLA